MVGIPYVSGLAAINTGSIVLVRDFKNKSIIGVDTVTGQIALSANAGGINFIDHD